MLPSVSSERWLMMSMHFSYKLSKDPTHNTADRRKAFYRYVTAGYGIELTTNLNTPDVDRLAPADIQLAFGPVAVHEEW